MCALGAGAVGPHGDLVALRGHDETKDAIRLRLRPRRRGLPPLARAAAGATVAALLDALPAFRRASQIVSYLADDGEVPTDSVHARLVERGCAVFLPALSDVVEFLRWHPEDPVGYRGARRGPMAGERFAAKGSFSALLPLVAWSRAGLRIGRGGGYYDRAFTPRPPGATLIGVAYEFQEVAHATPDAWDVPLDYVVTEQRTLRCARVDASPEFALRVERTRQFS